MHTPTTGRHRGWPVLSCVAAAAALTLAGCNDDYEADPVEIRTTSNRADMVSGGDVTLQIVLPAGGRTDGLRVDVGGRDVSSAFRLQADGTYRGVVTGLADGANVITAATLNTRAASLTVTNAPRHGPVFSGAQIKPFYCATPVQQAVNGIVPASNASGLSGTADANCNIATEFKLYYRTTTAGCSLGLPDATAAIAATATTVPANPTPPANLCFKPYTAGTTPADMATTTTDAGVTVPYIVRVERGTMNRGLYDIAVLHNPAQGWNALAPQAGWNGKVVFNFGASTGQPRRQARPATAWTGSDLQLRRGVMVVANSMTDSARNSNRVMMSETVMMMKEHITDTYGPVKFTIGSGCSGGSINSNMAASIMPGLLDGVTTTCTYPDSETTSMEVGDCVVLVEAYQKPGWLALQAGLTQAQINARKAAINGHPDQSACHAWFNAFGSNGRAGLYFPRLVANNVTGAIFQQPAATNNCELPNSAVYDPARPTETASLPRCNAWSWGESIWGKVTGSPAAKDTRDNVGVQYGLKALRRWRDRRRRVRHAERTGGRHRPRQHAARRAQRGRRRCAADRLPLGHRGQRQATGQDRDDRHARLGRQQTSPRTCRRATRRTRSPSTTSGSASASATASWPRPATRTTRRSGASRGTGLTPPGTMAFDAFLTMDQWLTTLKADTSGATIEAKVRSAKPASAADFCILPSDATQTVKVTNAATCDADPYLKPTFSPRQIAGGPRAEDVLKCQLKPLVRTDYAAGTFSDAQWARLQAVFSTGVCDWSKPGVGQQAAVSPLTFSAGPGGAAMPAAPVSVPK